MDGPGGREDSPLLSAHGLRITDGESLHDAEHWMVAERLTYALGNPGSRLCHRIMQAGALHSLSSRRLAHVPCSADALAEQTPLVVESSWVGEAVAPLQPHGHAP